MEEDLFAEYTYGKVALEKIKPESPDFRLYAAGYPGDTQTDVMFVSGAVFRKALRGPRKGQLCILVPGTQVTVYVHRSEIQSYEAVHKVLK